MNQVEMIPCDQVIAKLWEYVDGELPEEHAAQIGAHLEVCDRCFPQYNFRRAYKEFVRRTPGRPMPRAMRRRVFEAILAEESRGSDTNGAPASMLDRLRAALGRLLSPTNDSAPPDTP